MGEVATQPEPAVAWAGEALSGIGAPEGPGLDAQIREARGGTSGARVRRDLDAVVANAGEQAETVWLNEADDDGIGDACIPLPTSIDQCKAGGWQPFGIFKNQGDCVSFISIKGKNLPSIRP